MYTDIAQFSTSSPVDPVHHNTQMFTFLPVVGFGPGGQNEEALGGRPRASLSSFPRSREAPAQRPPGGASLPPWARVGPSAVAAVGLLSGGQFHFSRFHAKRPRGSAEQISRRSGCAYAGSAWRPLFYLPRIEKWDGWWTGSRRGVKVAAERFHRCATRILLSEVPISDAHQVVA